MAYPLWFERRSQTFFAQLRSRHSITGISLHCIVLARSSFDGYQILVARGDLVTTGSGAAEKSNSTAAGSSAPKGFITALSS